MVSTRLNQVVWPFVTVIIISCASLAQCGHVLHEERRTLPHGWQKGDRLKPEIIHPVRIALAQNGLEKGEELLMAVSDPDSPRYGQHWTQEEVHNFFKPSHKCVTKVKQWLEESIPAADLVLPITHSRNKGWIEFSATVQQLEDLLATEFHNYHHDSGHTVASTEAYYVPESVREHIDFIWPGITLSHRIDAGSNALRKRGTPVAHPIEQQSAPVPRQLGQTLDSTVPCSNNHSALEPACIRDLYGIPHGPAPLNPDYTHAIYNSGNDKYRQDQLDLFWSAYTPEVPKGTVPKQILINGAADTRSFNETYAGELFMDISLTIPLVAPNTATIISADDSTVQANANLTGGYNSILEAFDESYCTYSAYNVTGRLPGYDAQYPNSAPGGYKGEKQCGGVKPPSVLFSSWVATEDFYPISFQRRQCNEFMKLALQGTTVVISTGNWGVAGNGPDCWGSNKDRWNVVAPANCPYVTAVGGTKLKDGVDIRKPSENPELGYYWSGGGVSAIYARPKWQEPVVNNYLETVSVDKPGFTGLAPLVANNTFLPDVISDFGANGVRSLSGRAIPDLSALATITSNYIIDEGVLYQAGGTTVSADYIAAMISRINLERLSVGKPVVGFINPVLYKYAHRIVRDITEGDSNKGCNATGYPPAVGWDAVTGLGVLKYKEALDLWLSL